VSAFTPKRSLVRSQYRPPAQTPPSDLGRGRLTTGSDNNASTRDRASAISYCHDGPLRWSPDQRAGVRRRRGQRGNKPSRGGGVGDAPWWCTGPIRPRQATIRIEELCPLLRQGALAGRPAGRPSDDGDERAQGCRCRVASLRETAGNGRERLGPSLGRCPRSVGTIDWACQPRPHSPGQLRATQSGWPLRRRRHRHRCDRRPRSRCRRGSRGCPGLHWQGRAADWPFESAALSARPIVVVNAAGPGYEPSPIGAAGLADGGSLSCSA
jgi:hypothetical protein